MTETPELKLIVEAILLAADEPLNISRLQQLFENSESEDGDATESPSLPEKSLIKEALEALNADYEGRGLECVELASGYTLRVKQDFAPWVAKLWDVKPARYTRAFLETLALIAYKQPITRSEIEQVRGVAVSSHIVKGLLERDWIKVVGHRDVPGRPAVLATTKTFLDYFNLKSLDELPDLQDIVDLDKAGDQLEMKLQEAMSEAGVDLNALAETDAKPAESSDLLESSVQTEELTNSSEAVEDSPVETSVEIEPQQEVEMENKVDSQEETFELQSSEANTIDEPSNVISLASIKEES